MQELFVAGMVGWAVFAVASRYLPQSMKLALREALSNFFARWGWRMPLQASNGGRPSSACGGCHGCEGQPARGAQAVTVEALRRTARRSR